MCVVGHVIQEQCGVSLWWFCWTSMWVEDSVLSEQSKLCLLYMKYVLMRGLEWCTEEARQAENDPSMEGDNEGIKGKKSSLISQHHRCPLHQDVDIVAINYLLFHFLMKWLWGSSNGQRGDQPQTSSKKHFGESFWAKRMNQNVKEDICSRSSVYVSTVFSLCACEATNPSLLHTVSHFIEHCVTCGRPQMSSSLLWPRR